MNTLTIDARMINHSGIGVYIKNLIPLLLDHFETTLIGNPEELGSFKWSRKVSIIPLRVPIYSISEQIILPLEIPKCTIFWSPHYNIPVLPIKAKVRIVTIHDVYHLAYHRTLSKIQAQYAKYLLRQAVKISNHVITVSSFSKSEIIKYLPVEPNKISVIHNGIDHATFKAIDDSTMKQEVLRKYRIAKKIILYVGNVKPHKNLITLLKAFTELDDSLRKQYQVLIVGKQNGFITSDDLVLRYLQQTDNLNKSVLFLDYVTPVDLPLLYSVASILVFPSLYEGFGLPPLEAMACGLPVITSRAASMPEVCGNSAYYFDPLDVNQLTQKITELLTNTALREKLIELGLAQTKLYDWKTSAEVHKNVFNLNNAKSI